MDAHRDPLTAPPVPRLWWPVGVDPTGRLGPTKGLAHGPTWRTTSPDRHVPSHVSPELVEQRILEAYAACGDDAVVTGWAGLRLLGSGYFDGLAADGTTRLAVPIATNGGRVRDRKGVRTLRTDVPLDEIVTIHGMRCAVAERALFDQIRMVAMDGGGEWDQVCCVDMACAAQLTSLRRMARYRWTRYWYRDIRTLDRILPLCVEGARSPGEVDYRRVWTCDAGWSSPLCNPTILDDEGTFVGMPDLFDPIRSVAGEYAGWIHRAKQRHDSDLSRGAQLARVGIQVVEVTNTHLRRPSMVVEWLNDAEQRAAVLTQRWQLSPSVWPTLDQLLDRRAPLSR